jgi:hypothetical protein
VFVRVDRGKKRPRSTRTNKATVVTRWWLLTGHHRLTTEMPPLTREEATIKNAPNDRKQQ